MNPVSPSRPADTGTVSRAVAVLRELAEAPGDVQIKTLAGRLELPPSTVHRLLDLLAQAGMVERVAGARTYRAGREFFRLAALVSAQHPLRARAAPALEGAMREVNETAYLGVYLPQETRLAFAATCESAHPLGYRIRKDVPISLLTGASGRSVLAFLGGEAVDRALEAEGRDPAVKRAVKSRRALEEDLLTIRERGYAISHGQRIPGAVGIFAPVFDAAGQVVGCLGYTVPEQRFQKSMIERLAQAARRHADTLSATLGHRASRLVS